VSGPQLSRLGRLTSIKPPALPGDWLHRTEREYGSFYRAIRLPDHAEPDSARATMDDGVLTITIRAPREGRREGRRVSIEGA
jgi:HSP20 family protein